MFIVVRDLIPNHLRKVSLANAESMHMCGFVFWLEQFEEIHEEEAIKYYKFMVPCCVRYFRSHNFKETYFINEDFKCFSEQGDTFIK
jgi:hypothetical protein